MATQKPMTTPFERGVGVVGRDSGGLTSHYRLDDAEVVLVGLGSQLGTAADVVDELRDDGVAVGVLGITCFRPWPFEEVRKSLCACGKLNGEQPIRMWDPRTCAEERNLDLLRERIRTERCPAMHPDGEDDR